MGDIIVILIVYTGIVVLIIRQIISDPALSTTGKTIWILAVLAFSLLAAFAYLGWKTVSEKK